MGDPLQKAASDHGANAAQPRWSEFVLLACAAAGWCFLLFAWVPLATFPYQIDYGEGAMMEGALCLRQGRPLYPAPSAFPVVIHMYGPLAYAATAATLPSHGVSFTGGRVLMLLCALAIAAMIAIMLGRWTNSYWMGLAFGLLLPLLPAFRFWVYLLRADLMGIVISVIGLVFYAVRPRYVHWTIPCFVAALFCKYSLLAAPFAVFLHLLTQRRVKEAIQFALILGLSCGSIFWLLQRATGGAFAFHMFSTHPDRYGLAQFFSLTGLVWLSAPVVTGLAVFHVLPRFRSGCPDLASLYFVSASIGSVTAGKLGATTNHLLEWMIAACMCAGLGYAGVRSRHPNKVLEISVALGFSILLGVIVQNRRALQPFPELGECAGAYRYVAQTTSSRVLSQSLGPLLFAGKPILITDPFAYGQLVEHGKWPDSALVGLLNERYFGLIVLGIGPAHRQPSEFSMWPQSLLDAIGRNYHVVRRFNCRDSSQMLEPGPDGQEFSSGVSLVLSGRLDRH